MSWYQRADDNWTWLGGGTNINYKTYQWGYTDDFMGSPEWYLGLSGLSSKTSGAQMGMNDNTGGGFGTIQDPDNNGNDHWWDGTVNPMAGQWVKAEVEMKITNQNDGFINLWENRKKIVYYAGRTDNFGSLSTPRSVSIGGYTDNGGTNNWRYFADVYLDYSLARVVLANNANIANATIIEPQIPSAWNSGSITLSSNLGKFTSGQTAYLFVYDATGTPNATGYPVTIGSGGGGDTTPPTSPTNLAANATSSFSITVNWTASTDNVGVTGYLVERCQGTGCSNFSQVGTPTASPFVDSGLTANTFYNYHVRARDAANNLSGWSNVVGATTQSVTPGVPSISSVSGTWNHKATITVSGSGFGTKTTAAPTVWDDASGANVLDKWSGAWPDGSGASYNLMYRSPLNGVSLPHSNVSKYIAGAHCCSGAANAGSAVSFWKTWNVTFPSDLVVSYYWISDPRFTTTRPDVNYKLNSYAQGGGPFDGEYWYLEYYGWKPSDTSAQYHFNGVERPDANGHDIWWNSGNNPQTWKKIQMEINFRGSGNGRIRTWENGVLMTDYYGQTEPITGSVSPGQRSFAIGSYSDEGGSANWRYFSDVYIDLSLARVVLANNSNIANATIIEPQIPSAWNASSITLSSNLGKFTSGQTAYLFVYDSAGTPNTTGYPVTIGSGGGGDTTPPTWPTGTTFSANATSSSSITVTWSAATDNVGVTGYQVERCQGSGCSNFAQIGTPASSPFVDSGLTANTFYNYHVRAFDGASPPNYSGWSNVVGATTQSTSSAPVARNECANPPSGAVLCEDFENSNWRTSWGSSSFSEITDTTTPGPSQDAANKAIQFLPAAGVSNNTSTYKSFAPAQKMWVRWYTKYNTGFNFSDQNHGGGFSAGNTDLIGSSGNRPAGDSTGFASFWTEYNDSNIKFRNYSYYHGMYQDCSGPGSCYGDSLPCVYDTGGTYCTKPQDRPIGGLAAVPSPVANQWYCVEQYVDVGDPISDTQAAQGLANGEFRSYVDGALVGQIPNLHIRTNSSFQGPSEIFLQLYFHQATHNNAGQMFDNVVVSPNRIGCGTTTPDVTAPVLSNPLPSGTVSSPTTLSVTSDQSCSAVWSNLIRPFGYTADQTAFTTTGGTAHSSSASLSTGPKTLYYQCKDTAGNISNMSSANFTVGTGTPVPTFTLSANPTSITSGQSGTLTWSAVTNATSCTASGGTFIGSKSTSGGTQSVSPTTTTTYTLSCTGAGGTTNQTATVTVTTGGGYFTLGETNILPSGDSGNGNLLLAQQATLSQSGTLQSLSFYVTTASGNLRLGVYDNTGPSGGPGSLKAQTNSFAPTTGWNTQNVTTPVSLASGTYWLAYLPSSSSLAFVRDGTGNFKMYSYTFGPMPTAFSTTPTSGTDHWSLYATLTPPSQFQSCNTVTTANFSQSAYNSYGAPFDAFQTSTNLMNTQCNSADTHTINLTTGITGDTTRIVYTKGYWYDAVTTAWRQYTGTCTGALNGEWCQGSVSATITDPNVSTASSANPTYLVGMTCSVQGGSWKCGCRDTSCTNFSWQIQGAGL